MQLVDSTNGAACALAFDNATSCDTIACSILSGSGNGATQCSATVYQNCTTFAEETGEPCNAANTAFQSSTACAADFADGGAYRTCTPGEAAGADAGANGETDFTYIVNLFCGTGTP